MRVILTTAIVIQRRDRLLGYNPNLAKGCCVSHDFILKLQPVRGYKEQ
jgi:hypothetical protein